ncbi:MAG UNVERIFIED_CONTAM: pilus assembly protein [Planctomycetaceae bacterium]|jgi:Flp pilus assembly protein TadG
MKTLRSNQTPQKSALQRRGAAALEAAAMMGAWTVMFVGIFDFGSATLNRNLVSHVARQATRLAIVRGADAGPELPVWGPATQTFRMSDNHPIANSLRPLAGGAAANSFDVTIEWIDGGNSAEQRVRATVTSRYSSMLNFVPGSSNVPLRGRSTMPIAH